YLLSSLNQRPDLTFEEIQDRLHSSRGTLVSISTIARTFQRSSYSRKQLSRYALEASAEARANFILTVGGEEYSTEQFVCVDETGCTRNTTKRRWGWSPIGIRAFYGEYSVRGERYTLLPALSLDGVLHLDIFCCSVNSDLFDLFIMRLLDQMNPWPQRNSVIILDNASIHKSANIRAMVEARGCRLLYLPAYSPDLNPIEQLFAWLKGRVRKNSRLFFRSVAAADRAHRDDPYTRLQELVYQVTPEMAFGWFQHSGYVA
ncbi:DDE family endonuclease, partial [Rhizoctonia solani 123E]